MVYAVNLSDKTINPIAKFGDVAGIMNLLLPLLYIAATLIFLVMLLRGGFIWITSKGEPENIKKAQQTLTFAVLGLIIVIISYLTVKIIAIIFNIKNLPL